MKKSLIVFITAFGLSLGLTVLPLVPSTVISPGTIAGSISTHTLLDLLFSLIGLILFFAIFSFLADNNKITASKPTVTALLLGVMLGSATLFLLNIFIYLPNLGLNLSMAADHSVTRIFQFFLPALTALLFAELREKKSTNNLTAELRAPH